MRTRSLVRAISKYNKLTCVPLGEHARSDAIYGFNTIMYITSAAARLAPRSHLLCWESVFLINIEWQEWESPINPNIFDECNLNFIIRAR